ncbi:hypothetical protein IFR05_006561, partial [Cadophora sp. M221]
MESTEGIELASVPKRSTRSLPGDIWYLVFGEMLEQARLDSSAGLLAFNFPLPHMIVDGRYDLGHYVAFQQWAHIARTVCREFNIIFTPLVYWYVSLKKVIIMGKHLPVSVHQHEGYAKNAFQYFRSLRLCDTADIEQMALSSDLIKRCEHLLSVRIEFDLRSRRETPVSRKDFFRLSTIYLDAFLHSQWSDEQCCLVLRDNSITIECFSPTGKHASLSDFSYVAQCERSKSQPAIFQPLTQKLLQPLIRALEVSGDDYFCFDTDAVTRKMPPMQALDMFGCDCRHLSERIGIICDLSYLRQLALGGTNLSEGLKNLPVYQLSNLQVLHLYADDDTESKDFQGI